MRMALVHDSLVTTGGAERVFMYLCQEFPDADVFTCAFNPDRSLPYFRDRGVRTSGLDRVIRSHGRFRALFPLAAAAMSRLPLSGYDVVLTSSSSAAKYARPKGLHIGYLYYPTRAIWEPERYFREGLRGHALGAMTSALRRWDRRAARRLDRIVTLSRASQGKIREVYGRDASVVPSPIEVSSFHFQEDKEEHFLLVSRLEPWKRNDYAVEAFSRSGLPLRVVGGGSDRSRLERMAGPNVRFLGEVPDERLREEYARARAVVYTPRLEYGLVPLEANASGTPVVCVRSPGVEETMLPVQGTDASGATAVFFEETTPDSLLEGIDRFARCRFDPHFLRSHARRFDVADFRARMRKIVASCT